MRNTRSSVPTVVMVDVITTCECCNHVDVKADDFLEGFVDRLPEKGASTCLRVHFSSFRIRKRKDVDAPPPGALPELERHGAVSRTDGGVVGMGLIVRACGNGH